MSTMVLLPLSICGIILNYPFNHLGMLWAACKVYSASAAETTVCIFLTHKVWRWTAQGCHSSSLVLSRTPASLANQLSSLCLLPPDYNRLLHLQPHIHVIHHTQFKKREEQRAKWGRHPSLSLFIQKKRHPW